MQTMCASLMLTASAVTAFSPSSRGGFPAMKLPIARRALRKPHRGGVVMNSVTVGEVSGLKRVVVTVMGITSCLGNSIDEVKDSLLNAKCGLKYSERYEEIGLKSRICGRPDLAPADIKKAIDRKTLRFMGDNAIFAYMAMQQAIENAGLSEELYQNNPRVSAILGQGGTSLDDVTDAIDAVKGGMPETEGVPLSGGGEFDEGGFNRMRGVGPYRVTKTMGSTVSAVLTTAFKLQGMSYSISSACSTGAHCIGTAMEQIQLGKADVCFAGAGESECWQFSAMFDCMGALSTKYNDSPETASRAFDKTRDGFCIAGGGGVVVMEELEHAKARGAKILAEVVGYGANADGYDMVAPSGVGGERCMELGIAQANQVGGEKPVNYINTHGTSTPIGDIKELGAVRNVFDKQGYMPFVGSTKSLSGHALGAAGVHEAIYSLIMLNNDFLAESANIKDLVDEAEGMNILTQRYDGPVTRVMSNSFGFGGTNCCLIFDKYME
jgi:3-oxoacyl-[acyl-carrier-protein] synthase-1